MTSDNRQSAIDESTILRRPARRDVGRSTDIDATCLSAFPSPAKPKPEPALSHSAPADRQSDNAIAGFRDTFNAIVSNMAQVVVDSPDPIRLCVTAMIVGGHVLLEDNPGTGKTQLARALAQSIDASFKRIQFTPDLLPSDVVGITFYDQRSGEFTFRPGPVFASIVLADEINRASPKTQSALLEVMEEQHVTVDGVEHAVPQPFTVIATQNPVEQAGTYGLPEAQMDRFLIATPIGYPSRNQSISILREANVNDRASAIGSVASGRDVLDMRGIAESVHISDSIYEYIMRIVEQTRASEFVNVGVSMRGALALTRCTQVWAAADSRTYVIPDDVKALAVPVLAHRLMLTPDAMFAGRTQRDVMASILADVPVPGA